MHCDYHRPKDLNQALQLKAEIDGALYVAGGTDLLVKMKAGTKRAPALISLRNLEELRGVEVDEKGARIGAMTPVGEILEHEELVAAYPILEQAGSTLGSVQIRNAATVGGNLANASPCADMAPALLVLDAVVGIRGPEGEREVPLSEFFLGPKRTCLGDDEVLAWIRLPETRPKAESCYFKKRRVHMDLSLAGVAVLAEHEGDLCTHIRAAAGAVAPTPIRLTEVEEALSGRLVNRELIRRAMVLGREQVSPIDDVRSSAEYRRHIVGVYLRRGLEEILDWRSE